MTERRDLATIDQELADEAAKVSKYVGQPESKKITIDRSGNFVAAGGLNLGNEIQICVVDFCTAHDYYVGTYDPSSPAPPVCFARGRTIADLYPEDTAPEPQSETCAPCPHNQFGSRGNGKACKNTRNLAVVLADELGDDQQDPELHLLVVPPTALKSFDAAVLQCARIFNGPPIKGLITVRVIQQANYFTLQFSTPEANPFYADVFDLRGPAEDIIGRIPDLSKYVPTAKPGARR